MSFRETYVAVSAALLHLIPVVSILGEGVGCHAGQCLDAWFGFFLFTLLIIGIGLLSLLVIGVNEVISGDDDV